MLVSIYSQVIGVVNTSRSSARRRVPGCRSGGEQTCRRRNQAFPMVTGRSAPDSRREARRHRGGNRVLGLSDEPHHRPGMSRDRRWSERLGFGKDSGPIAGSAFWHRQDRRAGIDQGVVDLDGSNLVGGRSPCSTISRSPEFSIFAVTVTRPIVSVPMTPSPSVQCTLTPPLWPPRRPSWPRRSARRP